MQIQEKHKQAKIEAKASKKKKIERIPAEKGAPEIAKEDRMTKVRSKILYMMILGPNTLKTYFGPIILSFITLSHGLRYVLESPFRSNMNTEIKWLIP